MLLLFSSGAVDEDIKWNSEGCELHYQLKDITRTWCCQHGIQSHQEQAATGKETHHEIKRQNSSGKVPNRHYF